MAVTMLQLLTAVTHAAVVLTDSTLTVDKLHTVLCVWTVANRYFAPGRPLVVSLPRTTPDSTAVPSVILCHRGTICRR
jgi:hypothetical protein